MRMREWRISLTWILALAMTATSSLALASWERGHTSKSDLTPAQKAALLSPGILMPPADLLLNAPAPRSIAPRADLPGSFDWHDKDGVNWCTPVRDQGTHCGACFVFGTLGAMEAAIKIRLNDPTFEPDLSEQDVIACNGYGSCEKGGLAETVVTYAKQQGVPDEACYPYLGSDGQCSASCADRATRALKLSDYDSLYLADENTLKENLLKGPLAVSMTAYDDLFSYQSGVYSHDCKLSLSEPLNHIVVLVGWDDSDNSWIARNSWGPDWGMGGYFKIERGSSCFATYSAYTVTLDTESADRLYPRSDANDGEGDLGGVSDTDTTVHEDGDSDSQASDASDTSDASDSSDTTGESESDKDSDTETGTLCNAKSMRCNEAVLERCSADGLHWLPLEDCGGEGKVCSPSTHACVLDTQVAEVQTSGGCRSNGQAAWGLLALLITGAWLRRRVRN